MAKEPPAWLSRRFHARSLYAQLFDACQIPHYRNVIPIDTLVWDLSSLMCNDELALMMLHLYVHLPKLAAFERAGDVARFFGGNFESYTPAKLSYTTVIQRATDIAPRNYHMEKQQKQICALQAIMPGREPFFNNTAGTAYEPIGDVLDVYLNQEDYVDDT